MRKKIEISHKLGKLCYVLSSNLRPRELEPHALPSRPRTLNNQQTLIKNKAATYAKLLSAKSGMKYKYTQFCKKNNLEYNKLKASTLILHVMKW